MFSKFVDKKSCKLQQNFVEVWNLQHYPLVRKKTEKNWNPLTPPPSYVNGALRKLLWSFIMKEIINAFPLTSVIVRYAEVPFDGAQCSALGNSTEQSWGDDAWGARKWICLEWDYNQVPCTAMHCTVLHCTTLHCTALHCTSLYCTTLHCTAINTAYCTELNCTSWHNALYCTYTYCGDDLS